MRLIDAEKLYDRVRKTDMEWRENNSPPLDVARDLIATEPTVDAIPIDWIEEHLTNLMKRKTENESQEIFKTASVGCLENLLWEWRNK